MSRNVAFINYILTVIGLLTGAGFVLSVVLGIVGWIGTKGTWLAPHFARQVKTPVIGLLAGIIWAYLSMALFFGGAQIDAPALVLFSAPGFSLGLLVIYLWMWVNILRGLIRLFREDSAVPDKG